MRANLREMRDPLSNDWVATCGVCNSDFSVRASDSPNIPSKSGTFCPDCRARGLMAPGVLHWKLRHEDETSTLTPPKSGGTDAS
jgi:hypothetical protein